MSTDLPTPKNGVYFSKTTPKNSRRIPTMSVKNKKTGKHSVINARDFDASLHEKCAAPAKKAPQEPKDDPDKDPGTPVELTQEGLKQMSVSDIKQLDAYKALPEEIRASADKKSKIIPAILASLAPAE